MGYRVILFHHVTLSQGHRQLLSALKQRYALLKAELEQANRNREKDRKIFHESCLRHVAAMQELKVCVPNVPSYASY